MVQDLHVCNLQELLAMGLDNAQDVWHTVGEQVSCPDCMHAIGVVLLR